MRAGVSMAAGAAVVGGIMVGGTGVASAAQVNCVSPPTANDIQVIGDASCGATATGTGLANSGATESGTAVSVADGGSATTFATGFGVALAGAKGVGQSYAYSIGGGISRSYAENGHTTVALAGWGSGATAEANGVNCVGPMSFAINLNTGAVCALR
ncbi:DUF6764 family protein [Rhodococcus kronopolitis]|uniref:DUF6764 family protein n=1 Tax=Rhodococcus kronopolitis TaxID=1460226 RepID=A0ABV9FW67_9NOCA